MRSTSSRNRWMTTTTWSDLFQAMPFSERSSQRALGDAVWNVMRDGGTLVSECPVGTGKSVAYLLPAVEQVKQKRRVVVSTETTNLQDQLVDKDLPMVHTALGGFTFASLKGRSWYLCENRAGLRHWVLDKCKGKDIKNGERREVERAVGRRLRDDEWREVSGDTEYCAQNRCQPERCYSARARARALDVDIVVTNHSLLAVNAEVDVLGGFHHLVVDEAHTLERVLIDTWSTSMSPYEMSQDIESVWKGIDACDLRYTQSVGDIEEATRLIREGMKSIVKLFLSLYQRNNGTVVDETGWKRESFTLSQVYLSGNVTEPLRVKLQEYELDAPGRFEKASKLYQRAWKALDDAAEEATSGKRKIRKGATAARRLWVITASLAGSIVTRDGIIMKYGVPNVVVGEGRKPWKGDFDVLVKSVPLDISREAREGLWDGLKSVTLVSGTLRDEMDGSFRYVKDSLGLPDACTELVVPAVFDYQSKQLVYVSPGMEETVQVPGARYSFKELVDVLRATDGRALVLFTATAEMEFAAAGLRAMVAGGEFQHRVLVQEKGVSKPDLVREFMSDTSSVLLGSKSFFTGVDFPGESCSVVVLCKFPLPQWNSVCRAQNTWWMKRGHKKWYDREALQVFKQANGRLIRNETDRGVIAILDQRASDPREKIQKLVGVEVTATGSHVTSDIEEMKKWLG